MNKSSPIIAVALLPARSAICTERLKLNKVKMSNHERKLRTNELYARPEWYTTNCTTSIRSQHDVNDRVPWDWRILANGRADELLYEHGILDHTLPFAELKRRAHINERAKATNEAPDFYQRIRTDISPAAR